MCLITYTIPPPHSVCARPHDSKIANVEHCPLYVEGEDACRETEWVCAGWDSEACKACEGNLAPEGKVDGEVGSVEWNEDAVADMESNESKARSEKPGTERQARLGRVRFGRMREASLWP